MQPARSADHGDHEKQNRGGEDSQPDSFWMCGAAAAPAKIHGAIDRILSDFSRLCFAQSNRTVRGSETAATF